MAAINLRDYLKGIEELIDGGQTDEALAHCRHVLQTFPKNIDTYRLMGKAYLEGKRHSEASDLFQRVLSSVPDDFVAHIGMSIIREDEGNIDAGIWHMERAFESQPSNRAVQDELRRLYGKREGYEPPKVRLTRGALARMYSHGDLYNQAISELRSALSEDPQRPDLQVMLAEMYFKTNRHAEAIEVCSQIIQKLPYCLYANRLMVDILRNSQRDVEAQPYGDRVEELDPYAAQVNTQKSVDEVAADTITIDQLTIESPKGVTPPKAWTSTLTMPEEQSFEKEDLPDWLSLDNLESQPERQKKPTTSVLGNLEDLEPAAPTGELPTLSEPAAEPEKPASPAFVSVSKSTALQADQIPDWLRELRPMTTSLPPLEQVEAAQEPEPEPEGAAPRWTDELKEAGFKPTGPLDLDDLNAPAPDAKEEQAEPASNEGLTWLDEKPADTQPIATKPAAPDKSQLPSWLEDMDMDAAPKAAEPAKPSFSAGWLDEPPAAQETPAAKPAAPETKPSWLEDFGVQATEPPAPVAAVAAAAAGAAAPAFSEPVEEPKKSDSDWLRDLKAEASAPQQAFEPEDDEPMDELETTDRLEALGTWGALANKAEEPTTTGQPGAMEQTAEPQAAAAPSNKEDEDNLSWLENLAAKQGAAEEELLTTPEERQEAQPEWLKAQADKPKSQTLAWLDELSAAADAPKAQRAAPEADAEPIEDFEDLTEPALEGETPIQPMAEAETEPMKAEAPSAPQADLGETTPAWLRALSAEMEKAAPAAEPIAPRPMEEAPDWLKDLGPQIETPQAAAPEAAAEPLSEEPQAQEPASETQPEPWKQIEDEMGKLDWLEPEAESGEPPAKIETTWVPAAELDAEPAVDNAEGNFESEPADAETEPMLTPVAEVEVDDEPEPEAELAAAAPRTRKKSGGLRRHTKMLNPDQLDERISQARQSLSYGNINDAVEGYGYLLRRRIRLDEVIADLTAALRRFPRQVVLWQTLGDAYMRNNQLREALDCYTKAESLL